MFTDFTLIEKWSNKNAAAAEMNFGRWVPLFYNWAESKWADAPYGPIFPPFKPPSIFSCFQSSWRDTKPKTHKLCWNGAAIQFGASIASSQPFDAHPAEPPLTWNPSWAGDPSSGLLRRWRGGTWIQIGAASSGK